MTESDDLRDQLGRQVREVWMEWAREQPSPKPSWLVPWEDLREPDREVDRRIGEALYLRGQDAAVERVAELTRERDGLQQQVRHLCERLDRIRDAAKAGPDIHVDDLIEAVRGLTRERDLWKGNWERAQQGNMMLLEKFGNAVALPSDWAIQVYDTLMLGNEHPRDCHDDLVSLIKSWAGRPAVQEAPRPGGDQGA